MIKINRLDAAAVCLSLALLAGAGVDRVRRMPPADAGTYHRRVRELAARAPTQIGDWVGQDSSVPPAAIAMLRPNVILSRRFTHRVTGRSASFLLVQCQDARDMYGHFPPVCYVNQGWRKTSAEPRDWAVGGLTVCGTEYEFAYSTFDQFSAIAIADFMMMAGGQVVRDLDGVNAAAADARRRFYGAGQVQVICDANVPRAERDEVVEQLVAGHRPILEAILARPADGRN